MELVSSCVSTAADAPDRPRRLFSVPVGRPLGLSSGYRATTSDQNRLRVHVSNGRADGEEETEQPCFHL